MVLNQLPEEWGLGTFSDLNDFQSSTMQPERFTGETFELFSVPIFPEGQPEILKADEIGSTKQFVRNNDVLLCKINPRINRVWNVKIFQNLPQIASSEWIVFRQDLLCSQFYTWYFRSESFRELLCADVTGVGGSLTRAQPKQVAKFPVPVPPLAEQKVIADKLDTLLAQVETTKARLERIPEILKNFRQSVLAAAVSGKLTEEWRTKFSYKVSLQNVLDFKHSLIERGIVKSSKQDIPLPFDEELSALPDTWVWSRLITVCSLITDGKHGNCKDEPNSGFYFLSAKDVSNKKLVYENARQINQIEFKEVHQRTNLEPGDICIVNTGATVGKYAIAGDNEHTRNTTFQKSVAVVKVIKEYANNKFVAYYFEDATLRLLKASSGSAVNNLLLGTMKQLPIPLPPIEEQTEIVRRVEQLFAFADSIEQKANAALARVNNLTQSILAKAFRGELTADWRAANPDLITGNNSAEALLAKIKAERAKLAKKTKAKV